MRLRLTLAIIVALVLLLTQSTMYITNATSSTSQASWWDESWHYRVPYTLYSGDCNRIDVPIELEANFTNLLSRFDASGTFDNNSVRIIEYTPTGKVLWEIPSQFDKTPDYNAVSNAVGTVAWIMNGTTPAGTARTYYVYFDTIENGPKPPTNYTGVSSRTSEDYIIIQNERFNATIRYKNGVYLESLRFDRNRNGILEPNEEMVDSSTPYTLLVRVTDAEALKHDWGDPGFAYSNDENVTATMLRNGPVVQEITLSNVSLKNRYKEALNIDVELTFKIYKLNTRLYMKTVLTVNEELEISYAYERIFLDNKDLYDTWYIDETYNGKFSYKVDYRWFFSGVPTYGFVSIYDSSSAAGLTFIPTMEHYSKIGFGEYADGGPALRLFLDAGTWSAGSKTELENTLFAHFGGWSRAKEETLSINNPPTFVTKLTVHLVDANGLDLGNAELRIYDLKGHTVRTGYSNSTGWATFPLEFGEYTITPFWKKLPVASKTLSVSEETLIDPLNCTVYNLSVYTTTANGQAMGRVTVGVYQFNGTRLSRLATNSTGQALFQQLPKGDLVIKTYYSDQQFGNTVPIQLENSTQLTISEVKGLGTPRQLRYDIMYGVMFAVFAVAATIAILKVKHEKFILGLLICILIFATFFAFTYGQNHPPFSSSPKYGISAAYDQNTGAVTVGDVVRVRWKDVDGNGKLDDSNLYVTASNGTELFMIDLETKLTTPTAVYRLSEAETKEITYLDKATNTYVLYQPLAQEPNFESSQYQRSLNLRFVFSKPNRWEVALNTTIEMGKPYVQIQWEITEKGEGEGNYKIYPQIIPVQPFDRLILPANYTDKKLRFWNQKNGPTCGNPWRYETDWPIFGAFVANMHANDPNVYLHSGADYAIQTSVHASSVFARNSRWVHDKTASYFQYDFWVDWDGSASPSSDIEIEVWVPDFIDLANSQISYTPNGVIWSKYPGWTLTDGERGQNGFSTYAGCKRRLKITFPATDFTADDGVDTGLDYGVPQAKNDEYLVRLKVVYLDEGLTTYEFENSQNTWYGIKNMNSAWIWLAGAKKDLSIGIVLSKRLENLTVQADHMETYRNIVLGYNLPLTSNGSAKLCTNLVIFSGEATTQDYNSDGVSDMFDEDMSLHFPWSAFHVSGETFGQLDYNEGFDTETNTFHMTISKRAVEDDWNIPPKYMVCLPQTISRHFESDDAVFRFKREGYYVYDVLQTDEVLWKGKNVESQVTYQLYVLLGLVGIGSVLFVKYVNVVKKYKVVLTLFIVGFAIRLFFQSLSTDFSGTDSAIYGNAAKNFLYYGALQVNYISLEPHFVLAGALRDQITTPFGSFTRLIYPSIVTFTFILFDPSFLVIKLIDVTLGALLVISTFFFAKKLFNEKVAFFAGIITMLYPLLVYYSGVHPSTGIVTALLVTSALCAMVYEGKKAAFLTGFFTSALLLARFEFGFVMLGAIVTYYFLNFRWKFLRNKNFHVIITVLSIAFAMLLLGSYVIQGKLPFYSTKMLGGTIGETRAPTLLETLTNPQFVQIRLYNALYGWWYIIYQCSPFIFITALLGLLLNVKRWKSLSALYVFPLYGVAAYSMAVREQPHARFVVEYIPLLAILSAAFIVWLSEFLSLERLNRPRKARNIKLKKVLTFFILVEIIFLLFLPQYLVINTWTHNLAWRFNNGEIYCWIRTNTSPTSVIMAPSPVFAYHADREIVTIPRPIVGRGLFVDMDMIVLLIKHYNVDYIVIDRNARGISDLNVIYQDPLNAPYGFNLVYWEENPANFDPRILIYDVSALHEL